ncbi:hypothetical protein [Novosphingobium album (ex Liu et al. 2023)]|uniref:DUF1963 domain-containing protein n=1 Tax=Novosphingobium album (ex Liu et al. 2023) TaxID=3031130 RepID=A0ABT5WKM1_9SPHN|nr:hypothetical protein [Novosphingobium album (ex Liu et al. 2023)]MDE8650595.1 hypothetical protein [Novosphingobium album (ex Liu et al. 2023)]
MANHFTKASFMLAVTPAEAEVLRLIAEAVDILGEAGIEPAGRAARFAALGPAFAATFPPSADNPFDGFLGLFPDPDYPRLGFTLQVDAPGAGDTIRVWIHGDQVDIETAAALIQATAKSALPFGFEYALDCDRMRPGEFGGGFVVIREDDIEYGGSARGLEAALARRPDEAENGLVIAMRDPEEGLLFWNSADGFGALETATVYSETEASNLDLPIADDQPEWLALPAPLA